LLNIYYFTLFKCMKKISKLEHTVAKTKVFYDEFNQRQVFSGYSEITVVRRLEIS